MVACRKLIPVKYIRLPELLVELSVARDIGDFKKIIKRYKTTPLLIIDEWLLTTLTEIEARDLLEIIEARHHTVSTIFYSQFAPASWHAKLGEATIADAILDRIAHNSYNMVINGESMIKRKGLNTTD